MRKSFRSKLFLFAIIVAIAIGSACSKSGRPASMFKMGERVQMNSIMYTVLEADWRTVLGEGPGARVPKNRFVIVRMSITNGGVQRASIPTFSLVDAKGVETAEEPNGEGVAGWLGLVRTLEANATEHPSVLFDVPPGTYRLRIADESNPDKEQVAMVEIPPPTAAAAP